jgi:hypothetical protein
LAPPKPGVPLYPREWNLTGVYAILPNDFRKHKFIEINFEFEGDKYNESRYTENGVAIYIRDVLFEEGKEEVVKPTIKIESVSLETIGSKLQVQLENVEKYSGRKPYRKRRKKHKSPSVVLQGINYE